MSEDKVPEAVRPTDKVIDEILNSTYEGSIARQWVNWAAEEMGYPAKYTFGHPVTVQSFWLLYEACLRVRRVR
jgi:hypothetical protein